MSVIRIVIADDHPVVRRGLRQLFDAEGVHVRDSTDRSRWRTLRAAERAGRRRAKANQPSELIVRDAYYRVVLRREFRDPDRAAR